MTRGRKEEQLDIFTQEPSPAVSATPPPPPPSPPQKRKANETPRQVDSLSIFDINPDMSPETVRKLEGWIDRLDLLIKDLGEKQSGQYSPELESMKSVRDGMHTTATTGKDLIDIPPDDQVEKYIQRLERKIEKMPSAAEKAELDQRILAAREEKRLRLQTEGTYAKPFTKESALGIINADDRTLEGLRFAESQGYPVLDTMVAEMEKTRIALNEKGVFDVSQNHKASHAGISMGSVTGSFYRYLADKYSEMKDSKRGDYMQRIARTANFEIEHFGYTLNEDFTEKFQKNGNAVKTQRVIKISAEALGSKIKSTEIALGNNAVTGNYSLSQQ